METEEQYESDPLLIYLCEMPRLNKGMQELDTPVEKWLYILRNCSKFAPGEQEAFGKRYAELFTQARTKHLTEEELMEYFDSKITAYRARMLQEASYDEGFKAGEVQSKAEIAKAMLGKGYDLATIQELTGLSPEEIKSL
jgi:predicted transposase/invertase (TIGR01784 family)